jgi:hypothetical protein
MCCTDYYEASKNYLSYDSRQRLNSLISKNKTNALINYYAHDYNISSMRLYEKRVYDYYGLVCQDQYPNSDKVHSDQHSPKFHLINLP